MALPTNRAPGGTIASSDINAIAAAVNGLGLNLVTDFGLKADSRHFNGGLSGSTLSGATAGFTAADVGRKAVVPGAGAAGAHIVVTITAVGSATSATVTPAATTNVTGKEITVGTDNGPLLQAWYNSVPDVGAQAVVGSTAILPAGRYLVTTAVTGKPGTRLLGVGTVTGTEDVYDANGSVLLCATPGAATLSYIGVSSIAQVGADINNIVFWDVTAGGGTAAENQHAAWRGSSTCLRMKNINRWSIDRCSFVLAAVGIKVDYFYPNGTTVGDASWWYLYRSRFQGCGTGVDASPGGSGLMEGGDVVNCLVGVNLAGEAVPMKIHGVKFDTRAGETGIYGRSWMTTISQCSWELVSTGSGTGVAKALDLDGSSSPAYYGAGLKVTNCTFVERGSGPQNAILLGTQVKRAQFIGNHMFYVNIGNSSTNLHRWDTQDTGGGFQIVFLNPA